MAALFILLALVVCAAFHEVAYAQDDAFISVLLEGLDSIGLTNFTTVVRQVQADPSQPTFFLAISDSSTPKTLFVPNNAAFNQPNANYFGYEYQADDTGYLASLLLYHLVSGAWSADDLGTGVNHTVISTSLEGRGVTFLESDRFQSIALGDNVNGVEVYNQYRTTAAVATYSLGHVTIHVLNSIIGIPGAFSFGMKFMGLSQFSALLNASGVPDLDNQHGLTVFAPVDQAFDVARSQMSTLTPSDVFANHVIYGSSVYYPAFQSDIYASASGHNFTFTQKADLSYSVTLNSITVNILRSDFLTNNGVIHVIDGVLWNTTRETLASPLTSSSSSSSSAVSTASDVTASSNGSTSSAPANTPNSNPVSVTVSSPPDSSRLSLGSIVGIVAIVIFVLSLPAIAFFVWKYRRAMQGAKVRHGQRMSLFDLPSASLRPTPFYANTATRSSSDSDVRLPMSDIQFRRSMSGTSSTMSPLSQGQQRAFPEKPSFAGVVYQGLSPDSERSTSELQASLVPSSRPQPGRQAVPIPMTAEIVDQLWQQFAQRIDRGPPSRTYGEGEAPPTYPSSSRSPLS